MKADPIMVWSCSALPIQVRQISLRRSNHCYSKPRFLSLIDSLLSRTQASANIEMTDPARLRAAYQIALDALMKEPHPDGYWVGELSTSALSTATAVMALYLVQKAHGDTRYQALIDGGLSWLTQHQNED